AREGEDLDGAAHRGLRPVDIAETGDVDAVHFLRLLGEAQPELLPPVVEFAEIVGGEAELHRARRVLGRGGVERERRVAGRELAPEGRLELELEPERVAV